MSEEEEKSIRLSYIWKKITRLGFSPSGDRQINNWISIYAKSIMKFWEVPNVPKLDRNNIEVSNTTIPIDYIFIYNDIDKFNVKFFYLSEEGSNSWIHDVDKSYYVPEQPVLTQDIHMKKYLKKTTIEDVEKVLNGMFFHPTAHQHFIDEDRHSIRLGGGIHNGFQFLFHLRYQLCLIPENKEREKVRLTNLFFEAIKSQKERIATNVILDI